MHHNTQLELGNLGLDFSYLLVYTKNLIMKKELHPKNYRLVVFQDLNDNTTYLTRSTVATKETIKLDGVEYPLLKVHISSSSHPFYTGQEKLLDIEGRVDKFKARREAALKAQEARTKSATKKIVKAQKKAEEKEVQTKEKTATTKK